MIDATKVKDAFKILGIINNFPVSLDRREFVVDFYIEVCGDGRGFFKVRSIDLSDGIEYEDLENFLMACLRDMDMYLAMERDINYKIVVTNFDAINWEDYWE